MMIPMQGRTCGRLTVLEKSETQGKYDTLWKCRCSCGNIVDVRGSYLRNGHTKSCGRCRIIADHGDYMECTVKSGRSFLFDKEDLDLIKNHPWNVDTQGYVHGLINGTRVKLHRYLLNADRNMVVDHINNCPWDCRKSNLRIAEQHENTMNAKLNRNSTTGFKGVCFDKAMGRFMAHIHPNRRMVFLGYFDTATEAAKAYDKAALLYFGEYAKTNFGKGGIYEEVLELDRYEDPGPGNRRRKR